jgi:adenosylcobinamide-GDP ribazoletransferase
MIAGLFAAVAFLTIVPSPIRRMFTHTEMARAVGWFPLVGLAIGGLLVGVDSGTRRLWPDAVSAVLVLAAWVVVTGGLHLDGLMDSCDGLFGGRTVEDRLRILRDPRVGSFAVIGGILAMLTKYAVLAATAERTVALVLAPTLGRWMMAMTLAMFPYVRPEGAGRSMKDRLRIGDPVLATTIAALVVAAIVVQSHDLRPAIAMIVALVVGLAVAAYARLRIGGVTGDVCGAVCEFTECAVLLTLSAKGAIG